MNLKLIFFLVDMSSRMAQYLADAFRKQNTTPGRHSQKIFPDGSRMSKTVSLRQLKVGQKGKIAKIEAMGEVNRRIRDMGLIPGAQVAVVGKAPLHDPVALRLFGVTISLRNNEADHIQVELEE